MLKQDPMAMIQLDGENAIFPGDLQHDYGISYTKGMLTADNTTKLPQSFAVKVSSSLLTRKGRIPSYLFRARNRDVYMEVDSSTLVTFLS